MHWELLLFHAIFLFCCASLMLGWRTTWVKWVVLIGQISYAHRNPILVYGVDKILGSLLLILCFAPIGRAISLDRLRLVRAAKRADLAAVVPQFRSPWANACTRLMQIQMAVLFFYSGIEKIRGDDWWNGDAIWMVFAANDMYNGFLLDVFARHYWLVNVATYLTLLIELAFPFLIWQRATRPYLLAAAVFLHAQFATFMGMPYFSFVMIMGHMSFVRPEWLFELGQWWKRKIGAMEMIYDGRCGFCVRSMAWFLAFDGLAQIIGAGLPHRSVAGRQRCSDGKGALSRTARRPRTAGLRGLPPCGVAGAGAVVAGPVLLHPGAEPPARSSDLQLGRFEPLVAFLVPKQVGFCAAFLEHDPEKWMPVFGKRSCSNATS